MDSLQLGLQWKAYFFNPIHTKKKSCKVLEGEKNIGQIHSSRKNLWRMNGLKKKSYLQQITQPSPSLLPLGPSEVKWLAHKCVRTSFIFYFLFILFIFFLFFILLQVKHTQKRNKNYTINKVIKTKNKKKQTNKQRIYTLTWQYTYKY